MDELRQIVASQDQKIASLEQKVNSLVNLLVEEAPSVEKRLHILVNKLQAENAELRNKMEFDMHDSQE